MPRSPQQPCCLFFLILPGWILESRNGFCFTLLHIGSLRSYIPSTFFEHLSKWNNLLHLFNKEWYELYRLPRARFKVSPEDPFTLMATGETLSWNHDSHAGIWSCVIYFKISSTHKKSNFILCLLIPTSCTECLKWKWAYERFRRCIYFTSGTLQIELVLILVVITTYNSSGTPKNFKT